MDMISKKDSPPNSVLRKALKTNWVFSLLSGLSLILFEEIFQKLFELNYPFSITGIQLILFAAMVAFAAFHPDILNKYIYFIIIMDILWVLYCISVIFIPTDISALGNLLILLSAITVGIVAFYQIKGLQILKEFEK